MDCHYKTILHENYYSIEAFCEPLKGSEPAVGWNLGVTIGGNVIEYML